jgi:hypothetical protein
VSVELRRRPESPDPIGNCRDCLFAFSASSTAMNLECRRFPPTPLFTGANVASAAFPVVEPGDWCGEWSPAPVE